MVCRAFRNTGGKRGGLSCAMIFERVRDGFQTKIVSIKRWELTVLVILLIITYRSYLRRFMVLRAVFGCLIEVSVLGEKVYTDSPTPQDPLTTPAARVDQGVRKV